MEKLINYLNTSNLKYSVISSVVTGVEDIVLIENSDSKELRQLKSRLESRPSTLGLKVSGWKTNSYSVQRLSDSKEVQIVMTENNLVANYILTHSVKDGSMNIASRVGQILFLAQVKGTEGRIASRLVINDSVEFNFAFYLSVQEVAVEISDKDPETCGQLPVNITRAYLKYTKPKQEEVVHDSTN